MKKYQHLTQEERYQMHSMGKANNTTAEIAKELSRNRVNISQRTEIVDRKIRFGDLEADLIVGNQNQGALLTLVDRKEKYA